MTARTTATRRAARRQRKRRGLLSSALIVTVATLAGVSVAGGTYALLSDSAELDSAVVRSGTSALQVNGVAQADLGAWQLTPATGQAKAFTVTNVGDVPVTLSAQAAVTSTDAIRTNTQARLVPVANAAACTLAPASPRVDLMTLSVPTLDTLAAGQTKTYCLELSLRSTTPVEQSGQGVTFTLTMTSNQNQE